jgi:Methyltransferase domain
VNLKRYTNSYTVNFLKFILGFRPATTSVTADETKCLAALASGKNRIVEVGVFEGATSRVFCRAMDPRGRLYLVDPYFPEVRLERLLKMSFASAVASRAVRSWPRQARFVRQTSVAASQTIPLEGKADFIFIDARHDYESVLEDFKCWSPHLDAHARMAFHDSHQCVARPDLHPDDGPVRLMREVAAGQHGNWQVIEQADSVTVIERRRNGT